MSMVVLLDQPRRNLLKCRHYVDHSEPYLHHVTCAVVLCNTQVDKLSDILAGAQQLSYRSILRLSDILPLTLASCRIQALTALFFFLSDVVYVRMQDSGGPKFNSGELEHWSRYG